MSDTLKEHVKTIRRVITCSMEQIENEYKWGTRINNRKYVYREHKRSGVKTSL